MKRLILLSVLTTLIVVIFLPICYAIPDCYIGYWQLWSPSMWDEAIYRKYNTDPTYFEVKEWPRLNGLGANTVINHVGNENTHIQSHNNGLGMNVITSHYPLSDGSNIWTDQIFASSEGAYATTDDPNGASDWPLHYILQRYTDDGHSWLLDKLEETIDAMHEKYSFGTDGFAGYDFAQETWQNFHTSAELNRAFAIIDHGVSHIRKRDIVNPIMISMNFVDPIKRSTNLEYGEFDPFAFYNPVKPFLVNNSGAGWNIFTEFQYTLYSEEYIEEQLLKDKWSSYFGYYYQDRLDKKLNTMLQGSRWIYDYRRDFYESGYEGPEPFWVECIQAQKCYSLYDNLDPEGYVYKERQRRPRAPEYKINSYLGLIAGAEGVFFWPYNCSDKPTDVHIQLANGVVLDEKPEYELMPMQSQTDEYSPLPPPRPFEPYVRDISRGIVHWEWEDHDDETFRTAITGEDVHGRFQANPYEDIFNAFDQEIKDRLPIIKSLDWVWAVTGESDPAITNGPGVVRAMNNFTPRPDDYPNTLDTYFSLRDVLGDEELDNGNPKEEKTSNAKIGLFLNGSSSGVQYYLVLNSRCNQKNALDRIIDAPSDYFRFVFEVEYNSSYELIDEFTGNTLWTYHSSTPGEVTTTPITFEPGEARLLKFVKCSVVEEKSGNITGNDTWGSTTGTAKHYRIIGGIDVVGAGNSLTILPNTTIEVEGYYQISVSNGGELKIQGSEEHPVVFKPSPNALYNSSQRRDVWSGIFFWKDADVTPSDTIKNVVIKNATYGIRSVHSQQNFKNIDVESCNFGMMLAQDAPFNSTDKKTVTNAKIVNCNTGIHSLNSKTLLMKDLWVENSAGVGIKLYGTRGDVQVENSNILHSGQHGVKVYNQASGSVFIGDTTNVLYNGCGSETIVYSGIHVNTASYFVLGNRMSVDRNKYIGLNLDLNADCIMLGAQLAENGVGRGAPSEQYELFISSSSHIWGPAQFGPNAIFDDIGVYNFLIKCKSENNSVYNVYFGEKGTHVYSLPRLIGDGSGEVEQTEFDYTDISYEPDDFFLRDISENSPSELLSRARELGDEGNYELAERIIIGLLEDYANETIACSAQSYLCNLRYKMGQTPQDIIGDLEYIPPSMTAYGPIFTRHWLIANFMSIDGRYDDAQQKYLEIAELSETLEDSVNAIIASEEVAIQALLLGLDGGDGRTTSSRDQDFQQKQLSIANHQKKIDELYALTHSVESSDNSSLIPRESKLQAAYPNPFNPSVTIPFALHKTQDVKISIYNVLGQKVTELVNEQRVAGQHSVVWHGVSDKGLQVSSGIYFVMLRTTEGIDTRKIVMLK